MSDLVRTVAAVFTRKSVDEMGVTDFKHALSLDLRWFTPAEARRVLMHAADVGLVTVEGERVRAAFDPRQVRVPVDFRAGPHVLDERPEAPAPRAQEEATTPSLREPSPSRTTPPAPGAGAEAEGGDDAEAERAPAPEPTLVDRVLKRAAAETMEDPSDVRRAFEEEKARRAGAFTDEVVALVVARRRGVDVREDAERLLAAGAERAA